MNFCLWHVFQAYYNYPSFILAWFSIFNVHVFARCIYCIDSYTKWSFGAKQIYYFDFWMKVASKDIATFVFFN